MRTATAKRIHFFKLKLPDKTFCSWFDILVEFKRFVSNK